MDNVTALESICDYLMMWIVRRQEDTPMSPEVYERAVSVIGTVVPLAIFGAGLAAMLLLCFRLFGGWRHDR